MVEIQDFYFNQAFTGPILYTGLVVNIKGSNEDKQGLEFRDDEV